MSGNRPVNGLKAIELPDPPHGVYLADCTDKQVTVAGDQWPAVRKTQEHELGDK